MTATTTQPTPTWADLLAMSQDQLLELGVQASRAGNVRAWKHLFEAAAYLGEGLHQHLYLESCHRAAAWACDW